MKKILFVIAFIFYSPFIAAQTSEIEKVPLEKMAMLDSILGKWHTVQYAYENNAWKKIATSQVTYSKKLKGKMIAEEIHDLEPDNVFIVETFISYDQYRNLYRIAAVDDTFGLMDIYEGDFISPEKFQVTNLRAGTNFPTDDGGEMYFRLTFTEIDNDTREFLVERSTDNGMSWSPMNMNKMSREK